MADKTKEHNLLYVLKNIYEFFRPDQDFFIVALIYGLVVSILSLAIPIAVQSIVNTLAMTALKQQLIVLSLIVLVLLLGSSVFKAMQVIVVERFQRFFFSRVVSKMSDTLYSADYPKLSERNGRELANRFFDIVTVQKGGASLSTEGIDVVMQLFVGILILAFYHPLFILFDFILLASLYFIWRLYGPPAIASAIKESKAKYRVGHWVEEVASNNFFLKKTKMRPHLTERTDVRVNEYLHYREQHFKNLFGQFVIFLILYAVLSTLLLGLGGWLVMEKQLSLGQLVAAELIMTVILNSLIKSGKILELFYDTYAGVEKIKEVTHFDREFVGQSKPLQDDDHDELISFEKVEINEKVTIDLTLPKNQIVHIKINDYRVKESFINYLIDLAFPKKGIVLYKGQNLKEVDNQAYRNRLYYINEPIFFEDTIENNLLIGVVDKEKVNLYDLMEKVGLKSLVLNNQEGLQQKLLSNGDPLLPDQKIRLEFARAILQKPEILIINSTALIIKNSIINEIVETVRGVCDHVTVVFITPERTQGLKSDVSFLLDQQEVQE